MKDDVLRDLRKRFDRVKTERTTVQVMWDAIEKFITPFRGRMFHDQRSEHSIDWFNSRDVYDSTAVMAHQNLAASIHGSLTSPTLRWFDLRFRDEKLNDNKQAVQWLQDAAEKIHFELQDSNFDLEANKAYQDLAGYGTAMVAMEQAPGPRGQWTGINFTSIPVKEGYFECDWKDQPARFYRLLEWTPQQIISFFGPKDVPQKVTDLEKDGSTDKLLVLYVVMPRNNRIMKWGERIEQNRRPWAGVYMLYETGEQIGKDDGFYEMPMFVPRWETTNSSQWGNSPAMRALGDVLTLNQVVKDDLRAKAKMIDPPVLAEERSIITDLHFDPATVTTVRSAQGIVPFLSGASLQAQEVTIDRLQSNIRNYFLTDRIDFPDLQPQPMTATEAQIRYERMQRYLGATLAHLRNDLLNPIVERAMRMLVRAERIEVPPEAVQAAGGDYDIVYLGSLTRAQQTDEVTAIERVLAAAGQAGALGFEDAMDAVDAGEAMREIGRKLNTPAEVLRTEREARARKQNREDLQREMVQAQVAQQQGDAMQAQAQAQQTEQEVANNGAA